MTAPRPNSDVFAFSLSSFFRDHGGGVELVAHQLAEHLALQTGWRSVLAAHEHDHGRARNEAYEAMSMRCWNGLERLTGLPLMIPHPIDLFQMIRATRKADILIVHEEIYLSNLVGLIVALIRKQRVLVVKHTGLMDTRSRFLRFIQRTLTKLVFRPLVARTAAVVFVTEAKKVRYDPDAALERTEVIENGVDCSLFTLPAAPSENPRPVVLFVGRFVALKGLRRVRMIAEANPEWDFHLVGWGGEAPEDWGLSNVLVSRRLNRDEVASAFRSADVFLFAGRSEGVPLVVLEALASGLPVVAAEGCETTDKGLSAELTRIPDEEDGNGQSVAAWSAAVSDAIAQRGQEHALRRREVVLRRYSSEISNARYQSLLEQVLNR